MINNTGNCNQCGAWRRSAFKDLSEDQLVRLAKDKLPKVFSPGAALSKQGECADEVYCVGQGALKVSIGTGISSKPSIVRLVGEGELAGYRCIFSENSFRGTATALGVVHACRISKSKFIEIIRENSDFAMIVLGKMGQEIAAAERHHRSFCLKSARERCAEALIILAHKWGRATGKGIEIELYLTRDELSSWVGVAKETLIRCFSDFRAEGLIGQAQTKITILKRSDLETISGEGAETNRFSPVKLSHSNQAAATHL